MIAISHTTSEYWITARPAAESRAFLLVEVTALLQVLQQFSCKLEQKVVEAIAIVQNAYNSEIEQLTKYAIVMVTVTEWSTCFYNCHIMKFSNLIGAANSLATEVNRPFLVLQTTWEPG